MNSHNKNPENNNDPSRFDTEHLTKDELSQHIKDDLAAILFDSGLGWEGTINRDENRAETSLQANPTEHVKLSVYGVADTPETIKSNKQDGSITVWMSDHSQPGTPGFSFHDEPNPMFVYEIDVTENGDIECIDAVHTGEDVSTVFDRTGVESDPEVIQTYRNVCEAIKIIRHHVIPEKDEQRLIDWALGKVQKSPKPEETAAPREHGEEDRPQELDIDEAFHYLSHQGEIIGKARQAILDNDYDDSLSETKYIYRLPLFGNARIKVTSEHMFSTDVGAIESDEFSRGDIEISYFDTLQKKGSSVSLKMRPRGDVLVLEDSTVAEAGEVLRNVITNILDQAELYPIITQEIKGYLHDTDSDLLHNLIGGKTTPEHLAIAVASIRYYLGLSDVTPRRDMSRYVHNWDGVTWGKDILLLLDHSIMTKKGKGSSMETGHAVFMRDDDTSSADADEKPFRLLLTDPNRGLAVVYNGRGPIDAAGDSLSMLANHFLGSNIIGEYLNHLPAWGYEEASSLETAEFLKTYEEVIARLPKQTHQKKNGPLAQKTAVGGIKKATHRPESTSGD